MERAGPRAGSSRLAVVGFAFRFPGPPGEGFWTALREGRDLLGRVPESRWPVDTFYHPRRSEPGATYTRASGSIGDIDGFDAAFFGMSPREAAQLDPQQRLLLELTWEAFEAGGIRPSSLRGRRASVYIGFSGSDLSHRMAGELGAVDGFSMTGVAGSIAANRISYAFDLRGPSMVIDTACSSSLVAFHQACESILRGESELAVTGAVSLQLHPFPYVGFAKAGMLSRRGVCSPFDAQADGYVRSEGAAVMLLKRLDEARAAGDRIFAVVAGSAVNSDGKTTSLTVPSCEAQTALLRDVYARACIDPSEIDYLEAHGTGTAVGDPIEARALGQALGSLRDAGSPLRIGSVKSNLGHLETAAGMAGLVKAIYCLRERAIPPSIHFASPNPQIAFREWNLSVVTENTPLEPGRRGVIGVNSFGFGGANAHVILESGEAPRPASAPDGRPVPLVLSARSEEALRGAAASYAQWLRERPELSLRDIAWSAAFHRDLLEHRAVLFGADRDRLGRDLAAYAKSAPGASQPGVVAGRALAKPAGPVFVYCGNGSQWAGMGRRLLTEAPEFRRALDAVDACLARRSGFSVRAALESADCAALLEATEFAQPLLFAVQVGVTEMMRAWGVMPSAVLGHSVGEIAAAWACGALSLEQAVQVVCERSAAQAKTRGGGMTALVLGEEEARALLQRSPAGSRLVIAAVNSPTSVTLAGERRDLEAFESELSARSLSFRRLAVDYAFHSPAMDPLEQTLKRSLAPLRPAEARLPFYSTVQGERIAGEALDAGYWWRNVREPVQFARAVASLRASGASVFVEIGPHPVLRAPLGECLRRTGGDGRAIASMTRSGDGADALREKAFEVLVAGCAVDLARFFAAPGSCVDLPRYPWQRQRLERPRSAEGWDPVDRRLVHPLLGWRLPGSEPEWENPLDASLVPELGDHRVGGEVLLPASAFAEMALAAAEQVAERPAGESLELRELEIRAPLVLEAERSKSVRLRLDPADGRFVVRSRARQSSDPWRLHAGGRVVAGAIDDASPMPPAPQGGERVSAEAHYRMAAALGLDYGPAFRQVEELWRDGRAVTARLKPPPPLRDAPALLHPASLDACFQLLLHAEGTESANAFVPVSIARLSLYRPRAQARFARLEPKRRARRSVLADCRLYDAAGELIAAAEGVRFQAAQLKRAAASLSFIAERRVLKPVGAPAPLPSIDRLAAAARARLHAATRMQARERYFSDVEPLLEAMLGAFTARALADAGELPPERRALDQWLREFATGGEFPDGREIWRHLLREHPDHAEEIICLGGIGLRLPELLRGAAWKGCAPACSNQFSQALADVLAEALRALPAGRRLRLLVLDAGAAPGLGRILAQLDEARCECVVLCPGERFADEPRALAARYPGTRVCVADLEQPRLERPPELGEPFDLVIAEQGAGWAQDPKHVLAHLRELTAAQGVLALGVPRASRASAFAGELLRTIGFDAGFDSPLPGGEGRDWPELLRQSGFVDCLALPDLPEFDSGSSLLLARAAPRAAAPLRGAWLLLADSTGAAAAFALRLHAELERRGLRAQLRSGASDDLAGFDAVVHLAGLGAPLERQGARCESLARLLEACASLPRSPLVWAVTARGQADPAEAALSGFARSARNEYPQLSLRLADLAAPDDAEAMARGLADALLAGDAEDEIVVAAQGREVVRAEPCEFAAPGADAPGSIVRLDLCTPGQIKGLCWTRQALPAPVDDEVEIEVRAAGLNFRDVMYASGQLADHALENGFAGATLGMELSGVVVAAGPRAGGLQPGDAVIAFAPASFATRARTRAAAVVKKPGDWSFEAAATVPATFLTAYYALHHLARLEEGQRVLIHGAAGGVGIAAIQIAQMAGAEIFCTAGSEAKRDFLRMLGVEHVFDSRSLQFADQVMAASAGEGLDVVLNSLAGEAMSRSLRLLKPFGRFLELGKRDFYEDTRIGLRPLANNIAYFGVDADQLMLRRPELTRRLMQDLMALFRQRQLAPLPYRAFAAADAVEAFRFMQQSKHIGKVVLSFDPPPAAKPAASPQKDFSLRAEGSYLVTGGTRGFGLRTAQWLAEKGARHLVLASASGAPDEEGLAAIAALEAAGVQVKVAKCDVADRAQVKTLLAEIKPPLRGVVHAAALIRDGLTRKLDAAQIDAVLAPKARGAMLLDELTRGLPLDFFVLYSSATTVFGSPGQAAYVAANRSLEALAVARRAAGRPALCVAWGPIADAGYLARHPQVREALEARMGGTALEAERALAVLEQMLATGASGAAVVRLDRGGPRLLGAASPRLQALAARFPGGDNGSAESVRRWLEEFDDARLAELFSEILKKEVGEILRIAPDKLDARQPLADIGLDSLMGVELMTAVEVRFGVNIPVMALAQANSIEQLVARIVRELRSGRAAPEAGAAEEVRLLIGQHARDLNPEQMEDLAAALEAKRSEAEQAKLS